MTHSLLYLMSLNNRFFNIFILLCLYADIVLFHVFVFFKEVFS